MNGPKGDKKKEAEKRKSGPVDTSSKKKKGGDDDKPRGFDRSLDPERIIGATDSSGDFFCLLKCFISLLGLKLV